MTFWGAVLNPFLMVKYQRPFYQNIQKQMFSMSYVGQI